MNTNASEKKCSAEMGSENASISICMFTFEGFLCSCRWLLGTVHNLSTFASTVQQIDNPVSTFGLLDVLRNGLNTPDPSPTPIPKHQLLDSLNTVLNNQKQK